MTRSETSPPLTPLAESLPASVPFVGPEAQERARGAPFAARIGANESVFGPSPQAIAAMAEAAAGAWRYGDPEMFELRAALAAKHGVQPENIIIGEGIDGLLGVAARLFLAPGAETPVVTSLGAYPTFNYHVAGFGGRLVTVPFRDDREDLAALVDAAHAARARMLYVSNPDNPMGTWWPADKVQALIERAPADCLICLDEAYIETAPDAAAPPIDLSQPNLLRFRTFSKAMGLAGLRVGYAIGAAPLIKAFDKVRNHFGVGRVAQAGSLAALADAAYLAQTVAAIAASRDQISAIARENGLTPIPSAANFVAIDCGADGAFARAVLAALLAEGVFVRMPGVAPLDRCIRVSCGTDADLALFAEALPKALAAARGAR